jgi:hypothetical protein
MIFPALWRILPGPRWLKAVEAILLVGAVVGACFALVFPWVAGSVLPEPDAVVRR